MTEISAPWTNNAIGDASASPYSDLEWAAIWMDLVKASKASNGPLRGSGVSPDPGLTVQATGPASAAVAVTAGSALVRGTWYNTNATVTLPVTANASGNPRIDTVILRKDFAAQTVRLVVLPGTAAVSPVPPALTQTDGVTWEIPLANIAVASGFATITTANITPCRSWSNVADGVYLEDVYNSSGSTLETGDVVIWNTGVDRAVTTTATEGYGDIAGVWQGYTPAGGYGRLLVHGIGYVKVTGAVAARGMYLVSSSTQKYAVAMAAAATASKRNPVGRALVTTAGTGLCLAFIDVGSQGPGAVVKVDTSGAGSNATHAWADVNASAEITITPHTDRVKITAMGMGYVSGGEGYWDIYSVGLAARAGNATTGLIATYETANSPFTIVAIFTGLTPGVAQTFKLQHQSPANTITTSAYLVLWAEEL